MHFKQDLSSKRKRRTIYVLMLSRGSGYPYMQIVIYPTTAAATPTVFDCFSRT
jgi:hypothetical protein